MAESKANVFFDPDLHPDDTLKSFVDFVKCFELRYEAAYPDPPKVSLDAALSRWKLSNNNKDPSLEEYDQVVDEWRGKDMVRKCLGMFSSPRLNSDGNLRSPMGLVEKRLPGKHLLRLLCNTINQLRIFH